MPKVSKTKGSASKENKTKSKEADLVGDIPLKEIGIIDPIETDPILAEAVPEEVGAVEEDVVEEDEELDSLGDNWEG